MDLFLYATLLNIIYLVIGTAVFLRGFRGARRRDLLLQMGEAISEPVRNTG